MSWRRRCSNRSRARISVGGGQVYLRGLLTDGRRKSVKPMAARLGEDGNRQPLANFITTPGTRDTSGPSSPGGWRRRSGPQPGLRRHRVPQGRERLGMRVAAGHRHRGQGPQTARSASRSTSRPITPRRRSTGGCSCRRAETRSWGLKAPLAVADAGYGDAAALRHGLQARGLDYVVGISTTLCTQPGEAAVVAEPYSGRDSRRWRSIPTSPGP